MPTWTPPPVAYALPVRARLLSVHLGLERPALRFSVAPSLVFVDIH
jgi:hypothetical protein